MLPEAVAIYEFIANENPKSGQAARDLARACLLQGDFNKARTYYLKAEKAEENKVDPKNIKCISCHNPHGSANKKLLVAKGQALCDKCHASSPEFKRKFTHAAIDDGCGECHRPHASDYPRLLAKSLSMERVALFDPKQAELCLACHDLESFTKPATEATGVRIGTLNLHALHLNGGATPNKYGIIKKKDGQTCFGCHLPHTADQERLLRTEFQCTGTFCYTMRYQPSAEGGTCVVGCHKPKTYSRNGQDANTAAGSSAAETPVTR
jgi:predicted CXXCH cytochrome family protein